MRLDHPTKLLATLGAAVSIGLLAAAWVTDPSRPLTMATLTSLAALSVVAAVWRLARAPSITVLLVAMAAAAATTAFDSTAIREAASVALVVLALVGVLSIRTRPLVYLGVMFLLVVGLQLVLHDDLVDRLTVAGVTGVVFLAGSFLTLTVSAENAATLSERAALLDLAPVLITEQDWTHAERMVRDLGIDDPEELRDRLRADPEFVADAVSTVDVISVNAETRRALRLDAGEEFRLDRSRVHEKSLDAMVEQLVAIVTDQPAHDFEYETTRYDGTPIVVLLRSIVSRRTPSQTRILAAMQDITDRKESQVALQQALESKDQFVAGVSHELRTPLAAVVGLTSTLLEREAITGEDRELLAIVAEQSEEMAAIIEDLLVAARADTHRVTVRPQDVDPAEQARHAITGHEAALRVTTDARVWADPVRLRQILRNLLTNAERHGRDPITVEVSEDDGWVEIAVADAGGPIGAEGEERMFEPYGSTTGGGAVAGSIGLGLSVSRTLARLMGGDLSYRHDGRSVFTLTLPRHDSQTET